MAHLAPPLVPTLVLVLAACGGASPATDPDAPGPSSRPISPPAQPAPTTTAERRAAEVAGPSELAIVAPPALPAPATAAEAVAAARAELELVGSQHAGGTSKLYSRGDFLPLDDPRGMSTGDFVGRLRALFGEVPDDAYVLRHRATGLVITAYAAQSGPAYGGAGPPEPPGDREARLAKLQAQGNPRDGSKPFQAMTAAEMLAYRQGDHAHRRALSDARVHPALARVITRLDALVSAVPPVDWRVTHYWGEDPTVSVEGAEDGQAFSAALEPGEGLAYLLKRAESGDEGLLDASQGPGDADLQLVAYWGYHMQLLQSASARPRLERERARVQRAWFRLVERAQRMDAAERTYILALAEIHAPPLRLDRAKAAAALKGPAPR